MNPSPFAEIGSWRIFCFWWLAARSISVKLYSLPDSSGVGKFINFAWGHQTNDLSAMNTLLSLVSGPLCRVEGCKKYRSQNNLMSDMCKSYSPWIGYLQCKRPDQRTGCRCSSNNSLDCHIVAVIVASTTHECALILRHPRSCHRLEGRRSSIVRELGKIWRGTPMSSTITNSLLVSTSWCRLNS